MLLCVDIRRLTSLLLPLLLGTQYRSIDCVESFILTSSTTRRTSPISHPRNIYSKYERSNEKNNRRRLSQTYVQQSDSSENNYESASFVWNPTVRKWMGGLAAFGAFETIYLSLNELTGTPKSELLFCSPEAIGGSSSCDTVLSGQYAHIPGTDIPLAIVGSISYLAVLALSVSPLLRDEEKMSLQREQRTDTVQDDGINRVLLLATTTTMATFSTFLMSILFNVLHQACVYCVSSAICSISLASLAWFGGALPSKLQKEGVSLSATGGIVSTFAAIILFFNSDEGTRVGTPFNMAHSSTSTSTTLLATTESGIRNSQEPPLLLVDQLPPEITTDSSVTAVQLAVDLQKLDAKFYGAYWCSHCYEQKQAFGKQAMQRIPYVECSREGMNEQAALCKEKKIPGYPTWEISGKLYPGERALDEIQEIVSSIKK